MSLDLQALSSRLIDILLSIRDDVLAQTKVMTESEAAVVARKGGDTIYAIDKISEESLLARFEDLSDFGPFALVAEGISDREPRIFPGHVDPSEAEFTVIVDPIDGTRGLTYQKRPGWILCGVAIDRGHAPTLEDLELSIQVEIPLLKQYLADYFIARKGQGVSGWRNNVLTGEAVPLEFGPSIAGNIHHGFGQVARFFSGGRETLARIDDALCSQLLEAGADGEALSFEDQYLASGGQLYELAMGHDRWCADLRPAINRARKRAGLPGVHCCHPYDLAGLLVAREAGVIVTRFDGGPLDYPLDVATECGWAGFANKELRDAIMPRLLELLRKENLLP